ncbi:4Fe-4S single cluster domain-containing protein [Lipingzhangella sp. LS1_29]|uniref:4Fe-4S single cluster domain-containing protein n=1 Tax=Lipingzhangella rawalii TaxID=2055835 RepID=A0ABU2H1F9_9ACTN|nr:4Fe-4S single cluster domain-containing protein [Lipingzhangella rawalii]MDS1269133.1 4Fe-4S single cluster domain-containing protein [Lipingzhangella rawalii]
MTPLPPPLRTARLHYPVTALGPGTRLGIWTQGCPLACPGCMSRDTWDSGRGTLVPVAALAQVWHRVLTAGAAGVTISGGEPLSQPRAVATLVTALDLVRARIRPSADILLYTGYAPAELADQLNAPHPHGPALAQILTHSDAVITGRFDISQPTTAIWRGSANQQLHPLTPLGQRRYEPYVDYAPAAPPVQVGVDDTGLWIIGVPRHRQLAEFDRALRQRGLTLEGVSWRPSSTAAD